MKAGDYKFIAAWGQNMGSYQYYIQNQQAEALADGAPITVIYKAHNGRWVTVDECEDSVEENIRAIEKEMIRND